MFWFCFERSTIGSANWSPVIYHNEPPQHNDQGVWIKRTIVRPILAEYQPGDLDQLALIYAADVPGRGSKVRL